jgi:hypothetical protein
MVVMIEKDIQKFKNTQMMYCVHIQALTSKNFNLGQ